MKEGYVQYLNDTHELQEFSHYITLVTLIEGCQKEDCTELVEDLYKPELLKTIKRYENGEFNNFQRVMFKSDIVKAKKLISNET